MRTPVLRVNSEIGRLRKVLLHRPGREIENLTPDLMDRLLFDDIPYLEVARQEHDAFAEIFKKNDIEVLYLEDLMSETLAMDVVKESFINEFILEANVRGKEKRRVLKSFFESFTNKHELVDVMLAGV